MILESNKFIIQSYYEFIIHIMNLCRYIYYEIEKEENKHYVQLPIKSKPK